MAEETAPRSLSEVLLEQHLVTQEELAECLALNRGTRQSLANILIEKGYVDEEDLVAALCDCPGITHLRLAKYTIGPEVLRQVPEHLARRHQVLPVSITGSTLTLAMVDPLNLAAFDDLNKLTGLKVVEFHPVVAMRSELLEAIDNNYGKAPGTEPAETGPQEAAVEEVEAPSEDSEDREEVQVEGARRDDEVEDVTPGKSDAEEDPVVELARRILREAVKAGASDIHIEPFEKLVSLRYRIDGTLEDAKRPPKRLQSKLIARLKILTRCKLDESRLPQDGRLRIRYEGRDIDFRVGFLPCRYGEKVVLRILDKSSLTLDLDAMGFEEQPMQAFQDALRRPNGMVLMTGPTGSGKTTTLYSALTKLNTRQTNIVTVEDPIEYELFGINQVQTHVEIGLTFARVLREILRQDPNIVMVGEIRDQETADVAVKAALTGHLVLSTLHTNDAAAVYPRLIDMGVEPFLVQSSVVLAAAQRLLKRVCAQCKEEVTIAPSVLDRVQYTSAINPAPHFVRGRGCPACKDNGYKGRLPVIEAMPGYPEIAPLVLNKASGFEIKTRAMACGMKTLRQNALAKAARGITTIEQVLEHTVDDPPA